MAADERPIVGSAPGAAYAKVPIGTDAVATCVCMMYRARPTSCDAAPKLSHRSETVDLKMHQVAYPG